MRRVVPVLLLALFAAASASAAARFEDFERNWRQGKEALDAKNPREAERYLTRALAEAPDHPTLLYRLARAQALAGREKDALETLGRVVKLGFGSEAGEDPAFAAFRGNAAFRDLLVRIKARRRPPPVSLEYSIPERDLVPEGMAFDERSRRFFVGSLYKRKIVAVDASGRSSDFISEAQDGIWKVFGMKVDPVRRELVVCSSAEDRQMRIRSDGEIGRAGLFIFDVANGRLKEKYVLSDGVHLLNDLVVTRQGDVYATDSSEGSVYVLHRSARKLERFTAADRFLYPNGIALPPDEECLFVADAAGIARLDLRSRVAAPLGHPPDATLVGADGLYFVGNSLLAVQNGVRPFRIMEFPLDSPRRRVVGQRVVAEGDPLANDPTTGAVASGKFYFIGNSQIGAFDSEGRIWPLEKLEPVRILAVTLADVQAPLFLSPLPLPGDHHVVGEDDPAPDQLRRVGRFEALDRLRLAVALLRRFVLEDEGVGATPEALTR